MIVDARAEAWARLQVAGPAPRALFDLLRAFGSAQGVLDASSAQRRRHVPPEAAALLDASPDAARLEAALAWLREPGHELIAWDDPGYPRALLEITDPPPVFYAQGRRELLATPAFALVGSRNATPQGCEDAEAFAAALSAAGFTIVSGLALGIDAAAHRGGLRHAASSIAVIGTGPDRIYPARNRDLAHKLAANGLVISEFAPGTPPLKQNFPRRNRLVNAPEKVVAELQGSRHLEGRYLAAERVARPKDPADRAVLSSCVARLEDDQHRVSGVGIQGRLQLAEPFEQLLRFGLQLVIVRELRRPRR